MNYELQRKLILADLGMTLHLGLDKPEQMLLIHAARVMNVGINFAKIVKISEARVRKGRNRTYETHL